MKDLMPQFTQIENRFIRKLKQNTHSASLKLNFPPAKGKKILKPKLHFKQSKT